MTGRKSLSKKIRFEVLKRDSFKCQYCGEPAPDVVLHVDHIKPVSKGGDNTITNLVTACQGCNAGKGVREISDDSVVRKQKRQMDHINERRVQLEMMQQWQEQIRDIQDIEIQTIVDHINRLAPGWSVSEGGEMHVRKWLKKHTAEMIMECADAMFDEYATWDADAGKVTQASWQKSFSKIPVVAAVRERCKEKPYLKDLFYIRGILRNRLSYIDLSEAIDMLERAHTAGAGIDRLREFSKTVPNWSDFKDGMHGFVDGCGGID